MTLKDIARLRMVNQAIIGKKFKKPEDVVRHMGAMQAQDYNAAVQAVALRLEKPDVSAVEKAIDDGKIIRSWPMRRTIHLMVREDARWMLDLTMPIALKPMKPRGEQIYGLTEAVMAKAIKVVTAALKGDKALTRPQLYDALDKGGVATRTAPRPDLKFYSVTGRGLHILARLAHEQIICFGPRQGKQPTFVLLDEWVPRKGKPKTRDESLKELAIRYFTSHGPAQLQDLGWWSGLTQRELKRGIELAGKSLRSEDVEGKTCFMAAEQPKAVKDSEEHLLPAFDEFIIAYKDRDASLEKLHMQHINPGANGMFAPIIIVDGQVVGTWRNKTKTLFSKTKLGD